MGRYYLWVGRMATCTNMFASVRVSSQIGLDVQSFPYLCPRTYLKGIINVYIVNSVIKNYKIVAAYWSSWYLVLLFLLKEPFTVIVNFLVNLAFVAKLYFQFLDVFESGFGDKDVAKKYHSTGMGKQPSFTAFVMIQQFCSYFELPQKSDFEYMWPALAKQGTSRQADVSHFSCTVLHDQYRPYPMYSVRTIHRLFIQRIHEWLLL